MNTAQQTGGAVGPGLLVTIATSHTNSILAGTPHASLDHALVQGFDRAFLVAAGIAVAGAVIAFLTVSPAVGRVDRATKTAPAASLPTREALPVTVGTARPMGELAASGRGYRVDYRR